MKQTDVKNAVAAEVRAAAAREQCSLGQLAAETGISTSALNRKMRGKTSFTVEELIDISAALHIPVDALLKLALADVAEPIEQVAL